MKKDTAYKLVRGLLIDGSGTAVAILSLGVQPTVPALAVSAIVAMIVSYFMP